MRAGRLHLHEQVERWHRWRHEKNRALDIGLCERDRQIETSETRNLDEIRLRGTRLRRGPASPATLSSTGKVIDEVADVDHAARVVQRFGIDRQSGVAGRAKDGENFVQCCVDADGDDVGARHHDVVDAQFVQRQHVLEQQALLWREGVLGRGIVERVFDIFSHGGAIHAEEHAKAFNQAGLAAWRIVVCIAHDWRCSRSGSA